MPVQVEPVATLASKIQEHLCRVFRDTTIDADPFPHVAFEHAFPETIYGQMLERMPPNQAYRPLSTRKYRLEDGTSTRDILQLETPFLESVPPESRHVWQAVSEALRSDQVQKAVFDRLRAQLARRYGVKPEAVDEMTVYPRPALVRDRGGYEITPHPDTSSKVVTLQFYLPKDDSQIDHGTSLYRRKLLKLENVFAPRRRFEWVKRLAFRRNSGYGFVVTRSSWHGREKLPMDSDIRHTLLCIYYRDAAKAY